MRLLIFDTGTNRRKEQLSGIKLRNYAASRPQIRSHGPSRLQDYLWSAILPCIDDCALVFVIVIGCPPEVNDCQTYMNEALGNNKHSMIRITTK